MTMIKIIPIETYINIELPIMNFSQHCVAKDTSYSENLKKTFKWCICLPNPATSQLALNCIYGQIDRHNHRQTALPENKMTPVEAWKWNNYMSTYCTYRQIYVTGVDNTLLTFMRCRAVSPAGRHFTMDVVTECRDLVNQVFHIQSAEVGYSSVYIPGTNPPQCPNNDCTRPTNRPAELCNGKSRCDIPQSIVVYPPGSALCALQKDGNFIRIRYTCTTGMCLNVKL